MIDWLALPSNAAHIRDMDRISELAPTKWPQFDISYFVHDHHGVHLFIIIFLVVVQCLYGHADAKRML